MHHSTERILVTHVGSLPRSDALLGLLGQVEAGQEVDRAAFRAEVLAGLRAAVGHQAQAGIDIAGDALKVPVKTRGSTLVGAGNNTTVTS